jgi:thiol-disulfide isomerase/thioredoxin
MRHRFPFRAAFVFGLLSVGLCGLRIYAAPNDKPSAVLLVGVDGSLAGELRASADPNVLRWHSPSFVQLLDFPLTSVRRVSWSVAGAPPTPRGEYCFELVGDDCLFGDLKGLEGDLLQIDSARFGALHLRRDKVRRIYRWNGEEMVYFGPHGLSDWKDPIDPKRWHEEGGSPATSQYDASLFGSPGLPEKAMIELELSWKTKPDFVLELGAEDTGKLNEAPKLGRIDPAKSTGGMFRVEVWDNEMVLVGESKRDADLISLQPAPAGEGKAHIQIYLDQKQRRAIVLSRDGQTMGTIQIDARNARVLPGVRLTNKTGDVSLDALRISRWNGAAPKTAAADKSRLHRADGSVLYGSLKGYDAQAKRFTLDEGGKDVQVENKQVVDIVLNRAASGTNKSTADHRLRVIYRDGSRLSGSLMQFGDKVLQLKSPDIQEPLSISVADLQMLVGLEDEKKSVPAGAAGRAGTLKVAGDSISGRLVEFKDSDTGKLNWQPDCALRPGTLAPGVSGRIVYREPPPPAPPVPVAPPQVQQGGLGGLLANLFGGAPGSPAASLPSGRKSLHLRSGDVVPCEVSSIDERGVTFQSPLATTNFASNDKIKSVELVPTRDLPKLDEAKRDRLLTLPRLQKDSPPTHLICSTNGDFLRGRILSMNDKTLKVEIRLETREIPRDRVAQIIWLHADELAMGPAAPSSQKPAATTRVQVMRADGNRLTFNLESSNRQRISGVSEVLGACHADLTEVDQVLFGSAIEASASQLAYNLWKLRNAPEPRYVQAAAGGDVTEGEADGKGSPLVGQVAFPFKTPMLDGPDYDLAAHKGKIVVLDFWATWCGPCMQTAPLFEEVMSGFAGRDVELIGVNLEEQPEQIKSMLQRHKLKFRVALDRDGGIAARYAVTAIPQTVVIGRDGKIVRLFVGGGKKTADALRKTIEELLAAKP